MSTRTVEQQELHRSLVRKTLAERGVSLNAIQLATFEIDCWRAIDDNLLTDDQELIKATRFYLNLILSQH